MTAPSLRPRLLARIRVPLVLAAVLVLALAANAPAETLRARVGFAPDAYRVRSEATGASVSPASVTGSRAAGEPVLPVIERLFYVPDGFEVAAVRVTPVGEETIGSAARLAEPDPAAAPGESMGRLGLPEGAVVDGAVFQPTRSGQSLGGGNLAGFRVHSVALYPVRWESASGELRAAAALEVELDLAPRADPSGDLVRLRPNPAADAVFRKALRSLVENADDVRGEPAGRQAPVSSGGFAPEELPSVDGSGVDMVIVTTDALAADFAPFADWKTRKGVPAVVRSVEWIDANYPVGRDRAERIRDFVRDAYAKWGVYLVLLAGEHDTVPPLRAWTQYAGGVEIVTDQYFSCLDGDWNADGDDRIGEGVWLNNTGDAADLYPEVLVGRASVETSAEAATFVGKSLVYEKTPPSGWAQSHGGLGEVIFPASWEFGIDPPESIMTDGKRILRDSVDAYVPVTWARSLRYQSDNDESRGIALSELSFGHQILTVVGHGDAFEFSVGNGLSPLIKNADIAALTNGDRLTFFVGVSCNPNQIDLECMGETMMNNPNGGMIAVMASTRSDFPITAAAQTGSMLSMAFDSGLTRFGEMSQLGRVRYAAAAASDLAVDRWTWLTKLLLGDPELRIWTQEPEGLVVSHAGSVPLGTPGLTVTVQDSSFTAVAGALVCVSDGAGTYSRGLTDGAGMVTLPLTSTQTGTLDVVATLAEHRPHESTVTLGAAAGAHLAPISESIDDDGSGSSSGNGDGVLDAGETIELGLTVRNGGTATATGASVQGTIEAGGSATFDLLYGGVADPSKVFVGPGRVNPGAIPFTLDFASPAIDYIGRPHFTFAPDPLASVNKGDTGIFVWQDHDGWHVAWGSGKDAVTVSGTVATDGRVRRASGLALEPGDTAAINAGQDTLSFSGATGATDGEDGVDFALSDGTMVNLTTSSAALGSIAPAGQAAGTLVLGVAGTARAGQVAYVDLTLTSSAGGPWSGEVPLVISGPELEAYVFAVADSGGGLSGDGDGVVEVGETVRLTPTVINRGNGAAVAVNGAATAASGITFTDAADAYGEIGSLGESAGADGYVFTVDDGTGTTLDLTLTDSLGRTWMKTMDFVAPVAPDSVWFTSTSSIISVIWTRSDSTASPDVAGYNLYRSATSGSGFLRHNVDLLRTGTVFRDEGLAVGSTFYYHVTAVDSSGNESPATGELTAWATQVQVDGWPQATAGFNIPGLLITDADKDRYAEVYVGSHDNSFYSWDYTGSPVAGFPFATAFQIWGPASAADMDQDGDEEIFFGSRDSRVYAVHADASPLFGPNKYFKDLPGAAEDIRSAVTLADIDNDGRLEMIVGSDLGNVYAFNHDATGVTDTSGIFFSTPPVGAGSRVWGPFAVADLDNDGSKEIAIGSWNDSLYVVNGSGVRRAGFPKGGGSDFRAGAVFADLDGNGVKEILAPNFDGKIHAWNHDGTNFAPGGIFATLPDGIPGSLSVANLDADPELEVLVGCFDAKLYVFNHDGSSFRPGMGGVFADLPVGPTLSDGINATPIVVDVDGDLDYEIFVGHRNFNFYGFHHDGSMIVGMPIPTGNNIYSTAAAGDIDDDGDVDIAFTSYDGTVNVLDFPGASYPDAYQWPTYAGNNARTATYGDRGPAVSAPSLPEGTPLVLSLDGATPNPFAFGTTVRYVVPRDQRITLAVYNVSGRLVRSLVNGPVTAGANAVRWDGRDGQGRPLSSGVYFFRLQDDARSLTRKAVLLR